MRVKICGLTRPDDARRAQELGAWALGFIFYPKSKRYIAPNAAVDILDSLSPDAQTIGVFVNQTDEAIGIAQEVGLSGLQLHGDETPADCARVRKNFRGVLIKAFRPRSEADLKAISYYKGVVDYVLLDAAADGQYGGTGHTADWQLAALAARGGVPLILAGGLTAENILAANSQVKPFALDLSSGVEASPGVKDCGKLEALFGAIQGAHS